MVRAQDVMVKRVAGVHPKATVNQAMDFMTRLELGSVAVIDVSGALVGILTASDVMRRLDGFRHKAMNPKDHLLLESFSSPTSIAGQQMVEEVMTPELCAVHENTPIAEVSRLIKDRGVKRLPVLNGDKIVGMIHRDSVIDMIDEAPEADSAMPTSQDTAIKNAVHSTLGRFKWAPAPLIDVAVRGGDVSLRGTILQEEEREPLRNAIETIPGVKRYTDNLALAEAAGDIFPPEAAEVMRRHKLF